MRGIPPGLIQAMGGDPWPLAAAESVRETLSQGARQATAFAIQRSGLNASLDDLLDGVDYAVEEMRQAGAVPMILDPLCHLREVVRLIWADSDERAEEGCHPDCDGVGCMAHVICSHRILFWVQITSPSSQWPWLFDRNRHLLEPVVNRLADVLRVTAEHDFQVEWDEDDIPAPIWDVLKQHYGARPEALAGRWVELLDEQAATSELRAELPDELDRLLAKDHLTIDDLFGTS